MYKFKFLNMAVAAALALASCSEAVYKIDNIGINVSCEENREYSYTDKKSAYWYGRTHAVAQDWYSGWNIAKKRVLGDYRLYLDGIELDRSKAKECVVYPDRIERSYEIGGNIVKETFSMLDDVTVLAIALEGLDAFDADTQLACSLEKGLLKDIKAAEGGLLAVPGEAQDCLILLTTAKAGAEFRIENNKLISSCGSAQDEDGNSFVISYAGTEDACLELAADFRARHRELSKARKDRIEAIVSEYNNVKSNIPELDMALNWIEITMDELITCQQGNGIYAGLPWFNEYWGRDMFISMPGACFVTGKFDVAKQILRDFVRLQDTDPSSPTYGRIPNRANLEGILYNTTDGTPRLVIEALNLARYCGDTEFLKELYPAIKLSINASILNYIDEKAYLTHADADTWMDVKRNGIPGSPRGNRANDIQALWYAQLEAGAEIANMFGDIKSATEWAALASRLASNFESDYCDHEGLMIYDHLNADGTPDTQFRPNQLYCYELVQDEQFLERLTRRCWEELVYPWGVASLAQWDSQFHPQHENWHYYHKDDAYHNGTVWVWNNGMAMQRMLEAGQVELAWKLFCNMGRQALETGAVGSLSENMDAHPREGADWAGISGTFLQAWSNSEYLRVWYQYFLGIRPDLLNGVVLIEPHLPKDLEYLESSVKLGTNGVLHYRYAHGVVDASLEGLDARLDIRDVCNQRDNEVFESCDFCQPHPLDSYPCFSTYHPTPLSY